jgi:hypothetical protein
MRHLLHPRFAVDMVRPDWMHACCLGILQYLQGKGFYELFLELGGVPSNKMKAQAACARIMGVLRTMAKKLNTEVPFNNLVVTMFKPEQKAPKLKLKAAEGRYTLPILCEALRICFETVSSHAKLRLACVQALLGAYSEMDNWVDGGHSSCKLAEYGRKHLILYGELVNSSLSVEWLYYPKHHVFIHVCEGALDNPKKEWNYADESAIGDCARMAGHCHPL